jgi:hypothetical protein
MPLFDVGPGLNSVIGAASSALNVASNLAGALNNLSNPAALISKLRSINLPAGGMPSNTAANAQAQFGSADVSNDWRVRLSIPSAFTSSPVLQPLVQAGNVLIFPYTPTIQISSSASYEDQAITHQNYAYTFYQNSRADQFTINGAFHVEDGYQALYWIAAVHFLRSATKMFTGEGDLQGNPPPILKLNAYGDYVFKNVPVVVKSFTVELPSDVHYINTSVSSAPTFGSGSSAGPLANLSNLAGATSGLAGLAGALGANKVAGALGTIGAIGGAVAGVSKLLSGPSNLLGGGSFGTAGNTWVPVKSTISVTLQPIFSRENMKQFSLQKFVNGGYVTGGYI